jgi:HlyD family secretion protein
VTKRTNSSGRITNGAAFKGSSPADIFVLKNGKAERRTVNTGMSNFDFIELKTNIKPGEEVIISDMSEYKNAKEIKITD